MLIQEMYDRIPKSLVDEIMKKIGKSVLPSGDIVRRQPCIPKIVYIVLMAHGAFETNESDFFTRLAVDWIESRAIRLGINNILRQHQKWRAA